MIFTEINIAIMHISRCSQHLSNQNKIQLYFVL